MVGFLLHLSNRLLSLFFGVVLFLLSFLILGLVRGAFSFFILWSVQLGPFRSFLNLDPHFTNGFNQFTVFIHYIHVFFFMNLSLLLHSLL